MPMTHQYCGHTAGLSRSPGDSALDFTINRVQSPHNVNELHSLQTCTQLALWLAGTWHGANTRLHLFPAHTVRLRPRSFPLCTSSPRRRWGRGASRPGHALARAVSSAGQRWAAASGTSAGRAAAAVWGARARVLAQTAGQPALSHGRRGRHDGDYLTVRTAVMTPRALSRHNTHLSRYLIAMLRGLDLASRSDEALGKYVVQVKMNDLLEMQIAGAESDLLSTVRDKIEKDGTSTNIAYGIDDALIHKEEAD
ncbi:hypothetical protein RR48_14472 [Papilio machaon]|uniref:Uncharacterized protein n=1 Tax=Papilio machaon TaxID=76193 RepID=A0A194QM41_PAPMA|nr:hypothetical protein RR48_14472 [Papilio machaon]